MLRITFGQKMKYFFNAGPFMGYALKQTSLVEFPTSERIESDYKEFSKPWDFGLSAGAGIIISLGPKTDLNFEVRNNLGLVNTSKAPVIENGSIKTNSLNFLFGFSYKTGQ